jgi:uncharacterized protein (DUF58 family)
MASLGDLFRTPLERARRLLREWARQRQGYDPDPVTLHRRRIYIIPTPLGVGFGLVLFAMLLASMNYNNSMAFALTFLLSGLGVVAMHWCHQNLTGAIIRGIRVESAFAGEPAIVELCLENPSSADRYELLVALGDYECDAVDLGPGESRYLRLPLPTHARGRVAISRIHLSTRFPFGLFRCWTWLHPEATGIVYPRPAARDEPPPPDSTDTGGAQDDRRGEEDFAGLRNFRAGDSPSHVAWKAMARGRGLLVQQFAGTDVTSHWMDWTMLEGLDVEARLSKMTRWIVDAHDDGHPYGIRIPGAELPPAISRGHRHQCLARLALYNEPAISGRSPSDA